MSFKFQSLLNTVTGLFKPKDFPIVAKGTSGTEIFSGMFDEEYLATLLTPDCMVDHFDEMRRADPQVAMLLSVVKDPIKSATWGIRAVDDSDEELEIAEFVEHVLFKDMGYSDGSKVKTFSEFIIEALTFVEFGFSVFEVVHKLVENHPVYGTYHGIADIAFRHQRSILEWHLNKNGSIREVRQFVGSGDLDVDVMIDGANLLVFSINKEGDNYQGISMLRPCFGSFFRKNIYRKLQAIGIERAAKGVPIGIIPEDMIKRDDYEAQRAAFQDVLDKLESHETNSIILGAGFTIDQLKIVHDADKIQRVINSENVEMTKSFLANFMELGLENNSGSFALGSDLSDIFLSGLTCKARIIEERVDLCLIRKIVQAKFGNRLAYPKLKATGINDKAGTELAEVLKSLNDTGALQVSDALKKHVHELYALPPFDPDLVEEEEEEEGSGHKDDDDKLSDNEDQPHINCSKPGCDCGTGFDAIYAELKKNALERAGLSEGEQLSAFEQERLDAAFYDEARKDIRLASAIPSVFIARQAEPLEAATRAMLTERSDKMIATMANIFKTEKNRDKARNRGLEQRLPDKKAFKDMYKASVGDTANKALDNVLKELGGTRESFKFADDIGDLPASMQKAVLAEALLTAEFLDVDLEKIVLFTYNLNFDQTDSAVVLTQEITKQRDRFVKGGIPKTAATNVTSKVTNSIRNDVFQSPDVLEEIESFVFVNPAPVSAICQNLTGRVFSKEEYATTPFLPPLHHNCKSTIRAQRTKARNKKPIDAEGLRPTGTDIEIQKALKSISI